MKVYQSVHELIGKTPIVELNSLALPPGVRLFGKLEFMNPGGSVKDRLGIELLREAFESEKTTGGWHSD